MRWFRGRPRRRSLLSCKDEGALQRQRLFSERVRPAPEDRGEQRSVRLCDGHSVGEDVELFLQRPSTPPRRLPPCCETPRDKIRSEGLGHGCFGAIQEVGAEAVSPLLLAVHGVVEEEVSSAECALHG